MISESAIMHIETTKNWNKIGIPLFSGGISRARLSMKTTIAKRTTTFRPIFSPASGGTKKLNTESIAVRMHARTYKTTG